MRVLLMVAVFTVVSAVGRGWANPIAVQMRAPHGRRLHAPRLRSPLTGTSLLPATSDVWVGTRGRAARGVPAGWARAGGVSAAPAAAAAAAAAGGPAGKSPSSFRNRSDRGFYRQQQQQHRHGSAPLTRSRGHLKDGCFGLKIDRIGAMSGLGCKRGKSHG
uniref:Bradykinin-potentiating and C-type natriuretic peptides-like n=1 Tax=Petromyzon marinus TaxID=7757 RepID=A0AAJ7TU69_PETMA|nr:bradykinin-potentiating and C-type natriuretic peptides-like [Petromyzon marinus]